MKIGFVGLGKLGLPVSYSIAFKNHQIKGYDLNKKRYVYNLDTIEAGPSGEGSYKELLEHNQKLKENLTFANTLEECIDFGDIIFVAIQTPHKLEYEGVARLTENREDFNYDHLVESMTSISKLLDQKIQKEKTVIIISTVLPGTIRRLIIPDLSKYINLCYNPYFIAMGTVVRDFLYPEFILLGGVSEEATQHVIQFYKTITHSPVYQTSLENAEMIKVSYNTFIGTKICLANNIMEICDKLPNTNCDQVMEGLFLATKRIISPSYLRGGMGDGGGCHPRDNIALSWLSNKLDISYNFFDSIMMCREKQTEYIATLIENYHLKNPNLPVYLLGKAFKGDCGITTGSPAVLLKKILDEKKIVLECYYDPLIDDYGLTMKKGIYCLSTRHSEFKSYRFPKDSVIIDPFRYISKDLNSDCKIHSVGINLN